MKTLDELKEQFQCPEDMNLRYWLFALATKPTTWTSNADFMIWIAERKIEFRRAMPEAFCGLDIRDQPAWDAFLAEHVERPTETDLARLRFYFESMRTAE